MVKKNYSIILMSILIVLTAIVALSSHVLIIQYFNPPVINIGFKLNQMIGFIIRGATVFGAMLIYLFSKKTWEKLSPFYKVILFAILIMALTEQLLRSPLMEIVAGVPWAYQMLAIIPTYLSFLTLSGLTVLFMPLISRKKRIYFFEI